LPNKVHLVGNIFLKYTDGPRRGLWYFEVDVFLSWVKSWRLRLWCLTPLSTIFQLYHGGRVKSWIISLRGEVCANKTSLTPPLFIDVSIPSQVVIMYLCVKGIDFHLSTILIYDFGIVLTVWYFRIVLTVWYFRIVLTVWYFRIVLTVWYFCSTFYFSSTYQEIAGFEFARTLLMSDLMTHMLSFHMTKLIMTLFVLKYTKDEITYAIQKGFT
jgi:hypothetical protein